jgi:DNA repair and recombination protein RAD52
VLEKGSFGVRFPSDGNIIFHVEASARHPPLGTLALQKEINDGLHLVKRPLSFHSCLVPLVVARESVVTTMSDEFSLNYSDSSSNNKSNNNQSHVLEQSALNSYQPPGCNSLVFHDENDDKHDNHDNNDNHQHTLPSKRVQWVYNPSDGSVLRDPSNGKPVSVDRLLATKPLRGELSTRPGPGNKKLTYISGDGVARTLNDIFGFDGWNLDITKVNREECLKDPKTGKFSVVYTAMVRVTHKASGAYREECGTGDSVDRHFGTAVGHALKGSITDAMKRAARHFGDKLGNCKSSMTTALIQLG